MNQNNNMRNILKQICNLYGIDTVGIAPSGSYTRLEKLLEQNTETDDIQKRINPALTMENVESVIVCAFPYYWRDINSSNISKYTYSVDYHILVKNILNKIGKSLEKYIENFKYKSFTDNGPLTDRYLAYLSGIGFYGINTNIITQKYGSYVFIGYIINNYKFEPDKPLDKTCIQCGECIKKCPGGAILGNFRINPAKCVSYITQKKGTLTEDEEEIIKGQNKIFGCDICQEVCPHNKYIPETHIEEFTKNHIYNLDYDKLAGLSNKEFKRIFGNRAFSWRGKKILLRNLKYLNS